MALQAWRAFRDWPLWIQVISWFFFFWLLVPLLIWKTTWSTTWKIVLTIIFVIALAGAGSNDSPSTTVSGERASDGSEDESEAPASLDEKDDEDDEDDGDGKAERTDEDNDHANQSGATQNISYIVSRVVDGDTIEVQSGGSELDVRLIGVDTPETVHPSEPVQCFGPKASGFTKTHLEGKQVRLEFDVERRDRYGRTLAYVWTGKTMFNEILVKRGFGQVSTYPPNVKYVERFVAAQRAARNGDRGLWGACRGGGGSGDSSGSQADTGSGGQTGSNCDPNHQGACISPYPPDLNCDDVSETGFRSVGSDPHGFDGDADGIACE